MKEKYIGIFDSGIGGLTVVKSIIEQMPNENIVYFGDTAHLPYGSKSPQQIIQYVISDVEFLKQFDIKAVLIACNTADSVARETVSDMFDIPFYGVVEPASRLAATKTKNGKIGVIATNATVLSGAYERAIAKANPSLTVISKACPLLVPLVENHRLGSKDKVIDTVLHEYLEPLKEEGIDTLVLGCTHYPLLHDLIAKILPNVTIISSSDAAAKELKSSLKEKGELNKGEGGKREYYVSDNADLVQENANVFLGEAITVKEI